VSQVVRPMFGSAASACAIFGNAFTTGWRMPCVDLDQTGMAFAKREFWGGYWWLLIEMGIDVGNEHGLTWQSFQSWFSRPDFVPLEFRNPGLLRSWRLWETLCFCSLRATWWAGGYDQAFECLVHEPGKERLEIRWSVKMETDTIKWVNWRKDCVSKGIIAT
jgi:hypothetical protein